MLIDIELRVVQITDIGRTRMYVCRLEKAVNEVWEDPLGHY